MTKYPTIGYVLVLLSLISSAFAADVSIKCINDEPDTNYFNELLVDFIQKDFRHEVEDGFYAMTRWSDDRKHFSLGYTTMGEPIRAYFEYVEQSEKLYYSNRKIFKNNEYLYSIKLDGSMYDRVLVLFNKSDNRYSALVIDDSSDSDTTYFPNCQYKDVSGFWSKLFGK